MTAKKRPDAQLAATVMVLTVFVAFIYRPFPLWLQGLMLLVGPSRITPSSLHRNPGCLINHILMIGDNTFYS
jgi:hypothetical protein